MIQTSKTKTLFLKWPETSTFVEIAEVNRCSVEETNRDVLTLRKSDSHRVATIGLTFRENSVNLVLFAHSFDGDYAEYPLSTSAQIVLAWILAPNMST